MIKVSCVRLFDYFRDSEKKDPQSLLWSPCSVYTRRLGYDINLRKEVYDSVIRTKRVGNPIDKKVFSGTKVHVCPKTRTP